jgi:hypothetical protein
MVFQHFLVLFLAKVVDNALSTAKTILVQRNRCILAGMAVTGSNYIYLSITKDVITSDSSAGLWVVSLAAGVGCCLAVLFSNRFSKDRTYINVVMSDDLEAMMNFRDFLAQHHITNTANDSYALDWSHKSISVTAYAETKEQSRLIDRYLQESDRKYKRVINKV